jgi:hypothetical protein
MDRHFAARQRERPTLWNGRVMPLPPRAPELNGQENIWQFMRQNWLSNRIFKSFDDIVDHCCYAWNTLIDRPWKIMSIARRDWAWVTQCEDWYNPDLPRVLLHKAGSVGRTLCICGFKPLKDIERFFGKAA